jgi:hypothetical protein
VSLEMECGWWGEADGWGRGVVVEGAKLKFTIESGWGEQRRSTRSECHQKVKAVLVVSSIAFR